MKVQRATGRKLLVGRRLASGSVLPSIEKKVCKTAWASAMCLMEGYPDVSNSGRLVARRRMKNAPMQAEKFTGL